MNENTNAQTDLIEYVLQDSEMSPVTQEFLKGSLTRFRWDWIELCRRYWGLFEYIQKSPEEYLSKHMTLILKGGMGDFSHFLCQFESFFGEINERTVSLRCGLKNPREYFSKLRDYCLNDDGICDIYRSDRTKQILHEIHNLSAELLAHQGKFK